MPQPRQDDPTIGPDTWLWRRVPFDWLQQDEQGIWRVTSIAYIDRRSRETSVLIADLADRARALAGYPEQSLIAVQAKIPRAEGCLVVRDPREDEPSHALICPPPGQQSLSKGAARRIARASQIIELRLPDP